jgi:hypothetical protein
MNPHPAALLAALVFSCATLLAGTPKPDEHSSRDALDWAGSYTGRFTCPGGCPDCTVRLVLTNEKSFAFTCAAEPNCCPADKIVGTFGWDDAGQIITLTPTADAEPMRFFVGEGFLETVDESGQRNGASTFRQEKP